MMMMPLREAENETGKSKGLYTFYFDASLEWSAIKVLGI